MSKPASNDPSGSGMMILLLIIVGAAALMISTVSADTGVTIAEQGDQSYYLGEKVVFSGHNYDSDSTYLFITGPGIPDGGGKLSSPLEEAVSKNPCSFTVVTTKPDKTWDYVFYTSTIDVAAGSYTVYAAGQPETKDPTDPAAASVKIILKKPFLTAAISPSSVTQGGPFTVRGFAEGEPAAVQLWIIGDTVVFNTTTPVHPGASFTFDGDMQLSGKLPEGQYYLIVQHSMQNNRFDLDVSGDYVRSLNLNNGTNIFRISGPGSLQGRDAEEALIAAFSDNRTGDDTYTVIPFRVVGSGIATSRAKPTTIPVQQTTRQSPLQYAPFGAIVLMAGIALWKRG